MRKLYLVISVFFFRCFLTFIIAQPGHFYTPLSNKGVFNDSSEDGVLDTSFAKNGILKVYNHDGGYTQLIIQPDNKILGASYYDFYISRYTPDGNLDPTFGSGGFICALNISQGGEVFDMKLQPDGKIVAAGAYEYNWYPEEWHAAIVRLTAGGWPDPSFGSDGKIIDSGDPILRIYTSVAIQPDNKILVAGFGNVSGIDKIVICRYTPEGNPDNTFGNNGQVVTSIGNGNNTCPKMLLLEDGKILLSAIAVDHGTSHAGIMRLLVNGSLDNSFALNGKYIVPGAAYVSGFYGNSFFFQSAHKAVLSCYTVDTNSFNHGLLVRFTEEGFPDSTFGSSGRVQLPDPVIQGAVSQWDDKIIAVVDGFRIVRLTSAGRIDSTFGINGYASVRIDTTSVWEVAYSVAIQHGGKILGGGVAQIPDSVLQQYIYIYSMARFFSGLDCPEPIAHYGYQITGDSLVLFHDQSSSATQWYWDFGDSTSSGEQNPDHKFPVKGKYFTCLSITDTCGSSQYCDSVFFCDHVNTNFSYSGENRSVHFSDSSNQAINCHWDFGDSTFSDSQNPVHVFSEFKTYFVCLSARNLCNMETICDSIILKPNGITEPELTTLKIYPNPVSNMLKVEIHSTNDFKGNLQILNIYGVKIREDEIHNKVNMINTENIIPGAYQLSIYSKDKIISKKFIKIN